MNFFKPVCLIIASFLLTSAGSCSRTGNYPADVLPEVTVAEAAQEPAAKAEEDSAAKTAQEPSAEAQKDTVILADSTAISLVVRDYEAFRPVVNANGGNVTYKDSQYDQKSLNINIQEEKSKSVTDLFRDGADIVGVSIAEYALSIPDLKNANINTRICYSVSSNKNEDVILTKEKRSEGFLSGRDIVIGVKDSESLYGFLENYCNLAELNNSKKDFLDGLKPSVVLHNDFQTAFKAFSEEDADFFIMSAEQYKSVEEEAERKGYEKFYGGSNFSAVPKDTINVLVYKAGYVTNDIQSIITGALFALNEDEAVNGKYDFRCASQEKSMEVLYNYNTADDIIFNIMDIKSIVEQISKTDMPSSKADIINTDMLIAASPPAQLEKVGNYVGKNVNDVLAEEKEIFSIAQVLETSYLPAGEVTKQNPLAGEYLHKGDTVTLTVSAGVPSVVVPDLYGKHQADAESILADNKLNVGAVYKSERDDVISDLIVGQSVKAGIEVDEGSSIDLYVSTSIPETDVVPDLSGLTIQEADNKLKSVGLKLQIKGNDYVEDKAMNDKIVSQTPEAGTQFNDGDIVSVRLGMTYTLFPIYIMFYGDQFDANGIIEEEIRDAEGNRITIDQFVQEVENFVKKWPGKTIEVYGFVSSKYNNPTPGQVAANEIKARMRATSVRDILQKNPYLKDVTIYPSGENIPSGIEGRHNEKDRRVEIRIQN